LLWSPLRFPHIKRFSVRHYLLLLVGGLMSYLRYLCLFVYSGVLHILCCGFVLCTLCCQVLWIVHFWLVLRYSLTFIIFISRCFSTDSRHFYESSLADFSLYSYEVSFIQWRLKRKYTIKVLLPFNNGNYCP
jgi:hypothetical protein